MTAGFYAINQETGITQITNDYRNYALRQISTLAVTNGLPGTGFYGDIVLPGVNGMVAFRSDQPVMILYATPEGGNMRYRFYGQNQVNVTIYYFDDPAYGQLYTTAGIGLLVGNNVAAGGTGVSYDSRMKYLRYIAAYEQHQVAPLPSFSTTINSAYVPAIIQSGVWYTDEPLYIPETNTWSSSFTPTVASLSGNTFIVGTYTFSIGPFAPPVAWSPTHCYKWAYTIVNVAGM